MVLHPLRNIAGVTLQGLVSRPELNGSAVKVGRFDEAAGRYAVEVRETTEAIRVKPVNLRFVPTGPNAASDSINAHRHGEMLEAAGHFDEAARAYEVMQPYVGTFFQGEDQAATIQNNIALAYKRGLRFRLADEAYRRTYPLCDTRVMTERVISSHAKMVDQYNHLDEPVAETDRIVPPDGLTMSSYYRSLLEDMFGQYARESGYLTRSDGVDRMTSMGFAHATRLSRQKNNRDFFYAISRCDGSLWSLEAVWVCSFVEKKSNKIVRQLSAGEIADIPPDSPIRQAQAGFAQQAQARLPADEIYGPGTTSLQYGDFAWTQGKIRNLALLGAQEQLGQGVSSDAADASVTEP